MEVKAGYTEQGGQPKLCGGRSCGYSPDTDTLHSLSQCHGVFFQGLSHGENSREGHKATPSLLDLDNTNNKIQKLQNL